MNTHDISEALLQLHQAPDSEETLERLGQFAKTAVGCDDAGVLMLRSRGHIDTVAATGPTVARAHELQVELGEGPCLQAVQERIEAPVFIEDTSTETRYPRWVKEASRLGYGSVISWPLSRGERRYGSLNFYWHEPRGFTQSDREVAEILSRHAGTAIANAFDIEGLEEAVDSRKLIGIALGMVMERYDIAEDRAFGLLRRLSQEANRKLRDVAAQIVEDAQRPHAPDPIADVMDTGA